MSILTKLTQPITLIADELKLRDYEDLINLVKDTYKRNGNTKVTLVAHSMGCLVSLEFLNKITTQEWKDKHMHAFFALAGAWDGGIPTLQLVTSGYHKIPSYLPFKHVLNKYIVSTARTLPSISFLLPIHAEGVLVKTPNQEYGAHNLKELYEKLGFPHGDLIYKKIQQSEVRTTYPPPNVETYDFSGVDLKTPSSYTFTKDFFPGMDTSKLTPTTTFGDGDGTVNSYSSEMIRKWNLENKKGFHQETFSGVNHMSMIRDTGVLKAIAKVVTRRKW